ncbi:hypothetical protein ARMGADRAFT_295897 [Armillaria gallica]|uniref:Uncharacterized protein n=1 Tax=Armillaria gallica TaxID=47427 RepID=A0A2H3DFU8_ARMGA|nr:hypothetical protein ARMGADRAFT_295897 [Armillaria gallica]
MSYAPPPYEDSQWPSLKPPRHKALRRRYHPYARRGSILPPSPLSSWNEIVHEEFTKQTVGMVNGPTGRWKTVFAILVVLAIFLRVGENICRCDVF